MTPTRRRPSRRNPIMGNGATRSSRLGSLCVGAALSVPLTWSANVAAQDAMRGDAMNEVTDLAAHGGRSLSFRREIFHYVTENRRDPFAPPGSLTTGIPTVGGVRLLGIVHHPDAALGVVLLEVLLLREEDDGGAPAPDPMSTGVRLRIGDSVGGTSVVEIHPDRVVVDIASSDGVVRRVLEVSSGERGMSQ